MGVLAVGGAGFGFTEAVGFAGVAVVGVAEVVGRPACVFFAVRMESFC